MTPGSPRDRWRRAPIRVRLGIALALALAPILLLSALQSTLNFQHEAKSQRSELAEAAERGASAVRTRIAASELLLRTLAPASTGPHCARRLADTGAASPGFLNLIRFDAAGFVICDVKRAPLDAARTGRPWFRDLARGAPTVITSDPGALYAAEPALLVSARSVDDDGHFDGALTAVMSLASLRPERTDPALPPNSQMAIVDANGRYLSSTDSLAFPAADPRSRTGPKAAMWFAKDQRGQSRVFTAAPLVGQEVWVLLSAPAQGVVAWAWVNPVSALLLPMLAFTLALAAVWAVADRGVVQWIAYLRRIAAIYARGRYGVHPIQALRAPPEIRELAETLDAMAGAVAARDALVKDTLAHKDDMMREIHHRVKNNLQVISSLLNMQQRALTDPAARAAISDTRQRISALALIYRALYQGPDLRRVDLGEFLEELIAQLIADTGKVAKIETVLSLQPLAIDPDRLAPLALFAVEAISNARKHGLAGGGRLSVTVAVEGENARLDIKDSGAAGVVLGAGDMGQGVGRTLMTAFARQLRGEVALLPHPDGGLTTRLIFPTPALAEAA